MQISPGLSRYSGLRLDVARSAPFPPLSQDSSTLHDLASLRLAPRSSASLIPQFEDIPHSSLITHSSLTRTPSPHISLAIAPRTTAHAHVAHARLTHQPAPTHGMSMAHLYGGERGQPAFPSSTARNPVFIRKFRPRTPIFFC